MQNNGEPKLYPCDVNKIHLRGVAFDLLLPLEFTMRCDTMWYHAWKYTIFVRKNNMEIMTAATLLAEFEKDKEE